MRRRVAVLLVVVAGCARDPESAPLTPGTKAVVAGEFDVALIRPDRGQYDPLPMLPPGTRVQVEHDTGYAVRTRADIDRDIASPFRRIPNDLPELLREKPAKYPPPHWRARFRLVDVLVRSGRHRGVTGKILRADLRAAK